jgi:hypothetical protein
MKAASRTYDLGLKSISHMLSLEEDLPLIGYAKVALLEETSEDELYEWLLQKGKNYDEDIKTIQGTFLGAELIRKIYLERDPLSLILKVHLLIENFINEVFIKYTLNEKNLTFKEKINLLKTKKLISTELHSNIAVINTLRNKYAHNYYYDLGDFSITDFSYAKNFYEGLACKRKTTRAVLNLKILQFDILPILLEDIISEYPFLSKKRLKKTSQNIFYKKSVGDRMSRIIDHADKFVKDENMTWEITLKTINALGKKSVIFKINSKDSS